MNNSRIVARLSSLRRHHLRRSQEGPAEGRACTRGLAGGAEGEGEAETTMVQAEKMEAKARGMRAFHLELLMASFSRAKNFSASTIISQASSSEISREME